MRIHVTTCSDLTYRVLPTRESGLSSVIGTKVINERRYRLLCRGDQFELLRAEGHRNRFRFRLALLFFPNGKIMSLSAPDAAAPAPLFQSRIDGADKLRPRVALGLAKILGSMVPGPAHVSLCELVFGEIGPALC